MSRTFSVSIHVSYPLSPQHLSNSISTISFLSSCIWHGYTWELHISRILISLQQDTIGQNEESLYFLFLQMPHNQISQTIHRNPLAENLPPCESARFASVRFEGSIPFGSTNTSQALCLRRFLIFCDKAAMPRQALGIYGSYRAAVYCPARAGAYWTRSGTCRPIPV